MFEAEDNLTILKRLKDWFNTKFGNKTTTVEGTFAGDVLAASAVEFEKAYAEMNLIVEAMFPQTSWGIYLNHLAEDWGLQRRPATPATVTLVISGSAQTVVPAGALFATPDGINFITDKDVTLDTQGKGTVSASSQQTGATANVEAETITRIPVSIYGVSAVTNPETAHDGYDEEDDETLRKRLLDHLQKPAQSGNKNHYIEWAQSVAGVGTVKCLPLWNGNGTVKVIITNINGDIASDTLVKTTADYIESMRPIGATVTVVSCTPLTINLTFKRVSGTADVETIKKAVTNYLKETAFTQAYVSYAQIGDTLLSTATGLIDYSGLQVNGGTENITLTPEQLPVIGEVTIT